MAVFLISQTDPTDIVYFDLTLSEVYEETSEITSHPVETGVNVVDHVRPNPLTVSLQGYVTNTPLERDIFQDRGLEGTVSVSIPTYTPPPEPTPGSAFRALGQDLSPSPPPQPTILTFDQPFDRILEVQQQLTRLRLAATLLRLISSTLEYTDLVISRVGLPRDEPGGASFEIDLVQIRVIQTATVEAPKPVEPRGSPKVQKGAQATKPVTGPEAVSSKSLALKLLEGAGVL
jgi:hypothetical protein